MSSSKLVPFEFDGKGVHVFEFNGQTWFIARDVGKALGICNIRDLIREILTEDERMYVSKYYDETLRTWSVEPLVGISDKSRKRCTNPVAISESGLYTVIMRSSKPQAVKFRKWVTSEVLPALRERGHYEMPSVWPQTRKQKPQAEQKAGRFNSLYHIPQKERGRYTDTP